MNDCVICMEPPAPPWPHLYCPSCAKAVGHLKCSLEWLSRRAACPLCNARLEAREIQPMAVPRAPSFVAERRRWLVAVGVLFGMTAAQVWMYYGKW